MKGWKLPKRKVFSGYLQHVVMLPNDMLEVYKTCNFLGLGRYKVIRCPGVFKSTNDLSKKNLKVEPYVFGMGGKIVSWKK